MNSIFSKKVWESYFLFVNYPELAERTCAPYRKHVIATTLLRNFYVAAAFTLVYLLFIAGCIFCLFFFPAEGDVGKITFFTCILVGIFSLSWLNESVSDVSSNLLMLHDSLEHAQRLEKINPLIRSMLS